MTPSMDTWAPTIIFRTGHSPGLNLGRAGADVFAPPHPLTPSARNVLSSQLSERSSWRTRYVSPSEPRSLKYRWSDANQASSTSATTTARSPRIGMRRLLAAVVGVALDANFKELPLSHGTS